MDAKEVIKYCLSRRGASEDFPFGPEVLVVKVASKMFALISGENSVRISLKCDPFFAQELRQKYTAITPGYHLNKKHWNTIVLDGTIPEEELCSMIDHSYQLVLKSLTRVQRQTLSET